MLASMVRFRNADPEIEGPAAILGISGRPDQTNETAPKIRFQPDSAPISPQKVNKWEKTGLFSTQSYIRIPVDTQMSILYLDTDIENSARWGGKPSLARSSLLSGCLQGIRCVSIGEQADKDRRF